MTIKDRIEEIKKQIAMHHEDISDTESYIDDLEVELEGLQEDLGEGFTET